MVKKRIIFRFSNEKQKGFKEDYGISLKRGAWHHDMYAGIRVQRN